VFNGSDYTAVEVDSGGYPVYGSGGEFRRASDYLFEGESVLFGRKGTIDRPLYVNGRFWTVDTMFYTDIDTRTLLPRFAYYWATTLPYGEWATDTALPSMTSTAIKAAPIVVPPMVEQRAIADFLDRETAQIDAFIAKNEELITLLTERREGAVAKAVTQGVSIGPTLRSCGVAWIGAVPTHWDVRPLRWAARMRTGTTPTGENVFAEDPGEPWFRPDDLDLTGAPSMATRWLSPAAAEQGKPAPAGSTLVCTIGATVGKAGRIIEAAYFNQQITAVWWNMNSEYLYWALSAARSALKGLSVGNTLPILNNSKLGELRLPVPPEAEQIAIVAELRVQTDQIDAAIATAQRSTDLARERRAALISAAVTGKIDVGVSA
jgi:type I restriction enzyme S subunit